MANRLFCFGMGYTAQALADDLQAEGWTVAGTTREPSAQGRLAARGKVTSADNLALGIQAQSVDGEALLRALQSDYWPREKLGPISVTAQVALGIHYYTK